MRFWIVLLVLVVVSSSFGCVSTSGTVMVSEERSLSRNIDGHRCSFSFDGNVVTVSCSDASNSPAVIFENGSDSLVGREVVNGRIVDSWRIDLEWSDTYSDGEALINYGWGEGS